MQFHEKLFNLRKQAHMTQEELAEKLNVSRQAVSRWEMGTALPEVSTLIAISDLFGVTLDELLKNKESAPEDVPEPSALLPAFRDFLPKQWWLPGVGAVLSKLLSWGLLLFAYFMPLHFRRYYEQEWLLWQEFLDPVLEKLTVFFAGWFVLTIGWTLLKWWKAK